MEEINGNEKQANTYLESIRTLRDGKSIEDSDVYLEQRESLIPLESLIDSMESINDVIRKTSNSEVHSVRNHLKYMLGKIHSHEDRRYDILFVDLAKGGYGTPACKRVPAKKLPTGYIDKLCGFACKEGQLLWTDEKIDEFIESLRNQSRISQ